MIILTLEVTDVAFLAGVELEVADRCNEHVDTAGDATKEKVCKGSGLPSLGLKRGVVDDKATDPAKEESEKETNQVIVVHFYRLLSIKLPEL